MILKDNRALSEDRLGPAVPVVVGTHISPNAPGAEIVTDFPVPLLPLTHVRSTLLTSSLESLRARGLFSRYETVQRSAHRDTILSCVAGEWLPLDVATAHYEACDALGLSPEQQIEVGRDVSKRIHDTFLRHVVRAARGIGVTPWLLLERGNSLQARLTRGVGVRITRHGKSSARAELALHSLLEIPYVMNATLGVYQAGVELLGGNVKVRVLRAESQEPGRLTVFRIDWT